MTYASNDGGGLPEPSRAAERPRTGGRTGPVRLGFAGLAVVVVLAVVARQGGGGGGGAAPPPPAWSPGWGPATSRRAR